MSQSRTETDDRSQSTPGLSSRQRDGLTVAFISVVALVLGLNLFLFFDADDGPDLAGQAAPTFELPVMESDETRALEKYRGQVVLLDFWATTCPPCLDQIPTLDSLANDPQWADRVEVFFINVDPDTEKRNERIDEFLEDVDPSMDVLMDDGRVQDDYGAWTIPTLVVVDADGTIVDISQGIHDETKLRELIKQAE